MMRYLLTTTSISFLLLSGCGGSNNSTPTPPPAPPPTNSAPTFGAASASASVDENTSGTIYTASATDSDGDMLTYGFASSGDAALFSIDSASGAVSFIAPPDFEAPTDLNNDNIYDLTLTVSDGNGGSDSLDLSVTVTNVDQAVQVNRVGTGFTQPLYLTPLPGVANSVLVLEKGGRIRILNMDTGIIDPVDFLDIGGDVNAASEGGLLGFAFAPDYATSGEFYVNVTATAGFVTEIRKYTLQSGRDDLADAASKDIVLTFDQPRGNHNAGWIGFDANDYLVIPMGDGGGGGDPDNLAQNTQTLLGKVIRIDVSGDDFPGDDDRDYAIPPGNTFTNAAEGLPEIFAIGLRNPFRSSFDPETGDLLIADVGQNAVEEISRLPMDDSSLNFGWRVKEGTQDFTGTTTETLTPPVAEYLHGVGPREGRSITGGYVYNGPVEALQDEYIFADFISDNIWSIPVEDIQNGSTIAASEFNILTDDFAPDQGSLNSISSFGLDAANNLYIVSISGDVFRLDVSD